MKKKVLITFSIGALVPTAILLLLYLRSETFLNVMLGLIFILGTFAISIVLNISMDDAPRKIEELFFKKGNNKDE